MSSGTQVDLDWAGTDVGQGGTAASPAIPPNTGAGRAAYLTDEEILGIEPVSAKGKDDAARTGAQFGGAGAADRAAVAETAKVPQAEARATGEMPQWMAALAGDPKAGPEAQALWREHQEFRAAFSSAREARAVADEARAIKELLPGGVKDVLSLREATQSVDRIDSAIFSGDTRAQSEVVAELARTNPAAFRSLFAEAAKVLAGMGSRGRERATGDPGETDVTTQTAGPTLRRDGEGWGTPKTLRDGQDVSTVSSSVTANRRQDAGATTAAPVTNNESRHFDPAAYANFERATNDEVARDVRGSIGDTLARVMPEGVAEGAARRIGEDIFNEVHRALAADLNLSEQVAAVLRDRRFGGAEQQRVAALLAGRAKQLVPSVARRVIGEWTSTVLNSARSKAARQAVAASRVDIAAPGGSLDSMPLRQMSAREVNYASMSDEEILGM